MAVPIAKSPTVLSRAQSSTACSPPKRQRRGYGSYPKRMNEATASFRSPVVMPSTSFTSIS